MRILLRVALAVAVSAVAVDRAAAQTHGTDSAATLDSAVQAPPPPPPPPPPPIQPTPPQDSSRLPPPQSCVDQAKARRLHGDDLTHFLAVCNRTNPG